MMCGAARIWCLCPQLHVRLKRPPTAPPCPRRAARRPTTSRWGGISTGPCWCPAGSDCTPTNRSRCSWGRTRTSRTGTEPTCPPGCASKGEKFLQLTNGYGIIHFNNGRGGWHLYLNEGEPEFSFSSVATEAAAPPPLLVRRENAALNPWSIDFYTTRGVAPWPSVVPLQPLHPVQWDGEHLEPPAGLPALLPGGRVQHGVGAAGHRRLQRRLRHLLHRTLLLPGTGPSSPVVFDNQSWSPI